MELNDISGAVQKMIDKLDHMEQKLDAQSNPIPLNRQWLDLQETCQQLKISKRTLQFYRDKGILHYSKIGGKIYFLASDIEEHLKKHYNKTK